MIVSSPADDKDFQDLLFTAVSEGKPMAIRYPRGRVPGGDCEIEMKIISPGQGELIKRGDDIALIAVGDLVYRALEASDYLSEYGISAAVINARYVKPLDRRLILEAAERTYNILTIEENVISGGFGSAVAELLAEEGLYNVRIENIGLPDSFIEQGPQDLIRSIYGLDSNGIIERVKKIYPNIIFKMPVDRRELYAGKTARGDGKL